MNKTDNHVYVHQCADSHPFVEFIRLTEQQAANKPRDGFGDSIIYLMPRDLFDRYERASIAKDEAEQAIWEWIEKERD